MRKFNILFTLFCLMSLILWETSCKKSTPKSKTELISRAWKVQKAEENNVTVFEEGASSNTVNYAPYRLNFNSTSFILVDYNNATSSGTWVFDANSTKINFTVPGNASFSPASVNVPTLSENSLIIEYTTTNAKGQNTAVVLSLVPAG